MTLDTDIQTIAALAVVALAAGWLIWRQIRARRRPGCSPDCGCGPKPGTTRGGGKNGGPAGAGDIFRP